MDDESAQALRGLVDRCARQEAWPPPRTELVYAILHENEADVSSLEHFEMEDMLEMELDEGAARAIMACVASGGGDAAMVPSGGGGGAAGGDDAAICYICGGQGHSWQHCPRSDSARAPEAAVVVHAAPAEEHAGEADEGADEAMRAALWRAMAFGDAVGAPLVVGGGAQGAAADVQAALEILLENEIDPDTIIHFQDEDFAELGLSLDIMRFGVPREGEAPLSGLADAQICAIGEFLCAAGVSGLRARLRRFLEDEVDVETLAHFGDEDFAEVGLQVGDRLKMRAKLAEMGLQAPPAPDPCTCDGHLAQLGKRLLQVGLVLLLRDLVRQGDREVHLVRPHLEPVGEQQCGRAGLGPPC